MVRSWALAATLGFAVFCAAEARAEDRFTEWDRRPVAAEGRPGEYRTTDNDQWIRLTPYVGGVFFDGGTQLEGGTGQVGEHDFPLTTGLALEFDAADLLITSFEFGYASIDRQFSESRNGTAGDQELEGDVFHAGIYVGLKNPELRAGVLQTIIGLGVGAFYFTNYEGTLPVAGGGEADVEFSSSIVPHATVFIRFDFDVSDNFKFGINLKNHLLLYATEEALGNMEADEFGLDNLHYAFEPSFYFSIAF